MTHPIQQYETQYMDRNPGPIIIVDFNGDLKYFNPATGNFLKKLGFDQKDFRQILPPDFVEIFHNCKAAGVNIPSTRIEYSERVMLWSAFFSEDMQEVMYQAVDITRLHRNEVALRAAKDKAEEGERLKAAFLNNMSHEIRTPLNSLLGFMNLLGDELQAKLNEDQQFYFELIEENGNRLARTIQEILDISHFSSGTYEVKKESIDIARTARDRLKEKESEALSKGLKVEKHIPDQELFAATDEYCLNQTMNHLIDNAIKYTEEGHLLLGVAQRDGHIEIRIEDSGPGMNDEMQRRIFVAFNQGTIGHTKEYQGIGLGLSLVRVYLDAIGATIDLDSSIGSGSRFKICIPN